MSTFEHQDSLPSLPVPDLNATLDKYLKCAAVCSTAEEVEFTKKCVEDFRSSQLAAELQFRLQQRAKERRNWLEDWWNDSYMEIRTPLLPFLSFGSKNEKFTKLAGSQSRRAADCIYQNMKLWEILRKEQYPVFKSRGTTWDMQQYHHLYSSNRTPLPEKDTMHRYFKTEHEGRCPTHVAVICRGNIWKVNCVRGNKLISPDELYGTMEYILEQSAPVSHCVAALTTEHRDSWAQARASILQHSQVNRRSIAAIEQAIMSICLTDEVIDDHKKMVLSAIVGNANYQWADKNTNVVIYKDGQATLQGEHSNIDAIVSTLTDVECSSKVRQDMWEVKICSVPQTSLDGPCLLSCEGPVGFDVPYLLEFEFTEDHTQLINRAYRNFEVMKRVARNDIVDYKGYGNSYLRQKKIYTDTVVQIAIQLAFAKVHGRFAPIYETASTRKFFHGRTETVRGRTKEMVTFGEAVMAGKSLGEQAQLFRQSYEAHNKNMDDCMSGNGIDRHFLGLRKILKEMNQKDVVQVQEPAIFTDAAWKKCGGDGNFMLSTSFVGYMDDVSPTEHGKFCAAMCADGYGTFYNIAPNRIMLNISDFADSKSDLPGYAAALPWAFDHIRTLLDHNTSKL